MTSRAESAMTRLVGYVLSATRVYRKGEVVKVDGAVTTIDNFPAQPGTTRTVDCHFVTVGFTEAAPTLTHRQFYDLVAEAAAGPGEFAAVSIGDLEGGPSYIALGAWLGDQTLAFQFMALGQEHGLWHVITPAMFGLTGAAADRAAGAGYVLMSGVQEPLPNGERA